MKTILITRNSSITLKSGHRLRNRIVVPPMASQTADEQGRVTEKTLDRYQRLAQSQAGLLIVEYTYVHASGKSEESQLGIQSDGHIEGLTRLAKVIHSSGALAGIQITHAGGKSEKQLTGTPLMGASAIAVPVKDRTLDIPTPMTEDEIVLWKESFLTAARRGRLAGFDLIELHSAHGYGLNQWLSPLTNQRTDPYGGSPEGRSRLLLETVAGVRKENPSLAISVRIPGQDFISNGLSIDDMIALARNLERAGVDVIHVSSGLGGWRRPVERRGEGYLVDEAEKIQAHVSIPVIGVGGIETGRYIDDALLRHKFQLAAVGRAILKDPMSWGLLNITNCVDLNSRQ